MQSMRRSRSVLVELMIAVLFLAIAACVLAQLFAAAWETGGESRRVQTSLIIARDALERFTAGDELPEAWTQTMEGKEYEICSDVTVTETAGGYLRGCAVTVGCGGETYARLETTCYTMEAQQDEYM